MHEEIGMIQDEIDEEIYENVEFGVILVSEVFGVELFEYKNEAERNVGAARLCGEIGNMDDLVERDVVLVANGDISLAASWDGEAWTLMDIPTDKVASATL